MQAANKSYYVYRHVRLDTGQPFYIGLGKIQEFKRAFSNKNRNRYWHNITNKTLYKVDILMTDLTFEEACEKEKEFIKLYKRVPYGTLCNLTDGGEGNLNPSESVREKLSLSKRGMKNPCFGKNWTKEKTELMKIRMTGFNNPNYGKKIESWQKDIISAAQKGRVKTEAEKNLIYSKTKKKVLNTATGDVYNSVNDAAVCNNVPNYTMSRWIKNNKKNFILL